MRRQMFFAVLLLGLGLLAACADLTTISARDVEGAPKVYATVLKPPNPLLLGHYRRSPPSEFRHPWSFHYWLVQRGDKYAVYYMYDSHKKNAFKGWADFTINGDTITSGLDGAAFFVEDGEVRMSWPGRKETYRMTKEE